MFCLVSTAVRRGICSADCTSPLHPISQVSYCTKHTGGGTEDEFWSYPYVDREYTLLNVSHACSTSGAVALYGPAVFIYPSVGFTWHPRAFAFGRPFIPAKLVHPRSNAIQRANGPTTLRTPSPDFARRLDHRPPEAHIVPEASWGIAIV